MKTMLDRARHLVPRPRPAAARGATVRSMTARDDMPAQIDGAETVFHEQVTLYPINLQADAGESGRR
jgi:hypothetical protein